MKLSRLCSGDVSCTIKKAWPASWTLIQLFRLMKCARRRGPGGGGEGGAASLPGPRQITGFEIASQSGVFLHFRMNLAAHVGFITLLLEAADCRSLRLQQVELLMRAEAGGGGRASGPPDPGCLFTFIRAL